MSLFPAWKNCSHRTNFSQYILPVNDIFSPRLVSNTPLMFVFLLCCQLELLMLFPHCTIIFVEWISRLQFLLMAYLLYFLGKHFTLSTIESNFYSHYQFHSPQVFPITQIVSIFFYQVEFMLGKQRKVFRQIGMNLKILTFLWLINKTQVQKRKTGRLCFLVVKMLDLLVFLNS